MTVSHPHKVADSQQPQKSPKAAVSGSVVKDGTTKRDAGVPHPMLSVENVPMRGLEFSEAELAACSDMAECHEYHEYQEHLAASSEGEALSPDDMDKIWEWNSTVPAPLEKCLHELFDEQARANPEAQAVCAWDGNLSYGELDRLSSNLAFTLADLGVQRDALVPICFEKSVLTSVALLGVLKAGGAFLLLDPSLPEGRLLDTIRQARARLILSSTLNQNLSERLAEQVLTIDVDSLSEAPAMTRHDIMSDSRELSSAAPASLAYALFTSGSTGTPKGVVMTHGSFASAVHHQKDILGLGASSRVLDLSSYSYATSVGNALMTLTTGGCLCVPHGQDIRDGNIAKCVTKLRVNTVMLTPTVARLLSPPKLPGLKTVVFLGEALRVTDIQRWWGAEGVRLLNRYGASECAASITVNSNLRNSEQAVRVGTGVSLVTWVVDPDDSQVLLPVGHVGELLLEGPTLFRGYLDNDGGMTGSAMVEDPSWLTRGWRDRPGRRGRLFRTGDLVQYKEDGSLIHMGRRDTLVKIRGQRVELGEVESRVAECMPEAVHVVAEVIVPLGKATTPTLAVFITLDGPKADTISSGKGWSKADVKSVPAAVAARLATVLPSYMVPKVLFYLSQLPQTATGKTDRKKLREQGSLFTAEQIARVQTAGPDPKQAPQTDTERDMQSIWARVLGIDAEIIGARDSFFHLGGDSVSAIKVVSEARKTGYHFSVADMLKQPTLSQFAGRAKRSGSEGVAHEIFSPFSLLGDDFDEATFRQHVAGQHDISPGQIVDVYPCTPLQQGLMSLALRRSGDYVAHFVLKIDPSVAVSALCSAFESVSRAMPILRTRIVHCDGSGPLGGLDGLAQVVLDEDISWIMATGSLQDYLAASTQAPMDLGQRLVRYALVDESSGQQPKWLVWTVHHALYDGWSMPLILDAVYRASSGERIKVPVQFQGLIKYIRSLDDNAVSDYWQRTLQDCECRQFPALPPSLGRPVVDGTVTQRFPLPKITHGLCGTAITTSTLIRAAWALVMGRTTTCRDVLFGVIVNGRSAPVAGIDEMTGPAIATVPFRVQLSGDQSISDYLGMIQRQTTDMISFEQTGLDRIASISPSLSKACNFQTLLVIQPPKAGIFGPSPLGEWRSGNREHVFDTYSLTLELRLDPDEILVSARFDSRTLEPWVARGLLERFAHVMNQLSYLPPSQFITSVEVLTPQDLNHIWVSNQDVPPMAGRPVRDTIEDQVRDRPSAPAVCAWDGELTYSALNRLATKLAQELLRLGVGPDVLVPLCFEKSVWTTVGVLAVIKAGGAFVLLDPSLPEGRLQVIVQQLKANVLVSSTTYGQLSSRLVEKCIVLNWDFFSDVSKRQDNITAYQVHPVSNQSLLYAVFTSGSTGMPKGVLVTNGNLAAALHYQTERMGISEASRVFDFASYSFDASISNLLFTLSAGGCLCVPSDQDRIDNLERSMTSLRANLVDLTPSLAQLLSPERLPTIETIIFGGEALHLAEVRRWWAKVRVIQVYGPCECTPTSTVNDGSDDIRPEDAVHIGKGLGLVTWVVDPEDHHVLLAPGSTGELLLEGPLVGRGYLDNDKSTAAAFVQDPAWLLRGAPNRPGRRGRLYKTGDLVKCDESGNLFFVGRKQATQVKVRGQRIELGEIEHTLRSHPGVGEAVAMLHQQDGQEPRIVSFVTVGDRHNGITSADIEEGKTRDASKGMAQQLDGECVGDPEIMTKPVRRHSRGSVFAQDDLFAVLKSQLPSYMIPQTIQILDSMPLNRNGKTDRLALLERLKDDNLDAPVRSSVVRQPTSEAERRMRKAWGQILNRDASTIGLDDSFFHMGGSSITAMRLVAEARKMGIRLTVADIFSYPVLQQLVEKSSQGDESAAMDPYQPIAPYSLVQNTHGSTLDATLHEISAQYHLKRAAVLDMYPCTPLQEGLMLLTLNNHELYVSRSVLELSPGISVMKLRAAWEQVAKRLPILRTRIVQHPHLGLMQIVLDELITWDEADRLSGHIRSDRANPMQLGRPLARFAVVNDDTSGSIYMVLTMHHALYDGWSMSLIWHAVKCAYFGEPLPWQGPPFNAFIKYVRDLNQDSMNEYWRRTLDDCQCVPFPKPPSHAEQKPKADHSIMTHSFPQPHSSRLGVTTPLMIRAAWALLAGGMAGVEDVIFGVTVSGRHAPLTDMDMVSGPTFATVPLRIKWATSDGVGDYLKAMQQQATDMIAHEQIGLHKLAEVSGGARQACKFQTLLVVQQQQDDDDGDTAHGLGRWRNELARAGAFGSYGLTLVAQLREDMVEVEAAIDPRVLKPSLVGRLLRRLEYIMVQLDQANPQSPLSKIDMVTPEDTEQIWRWNGRVPVASKQCVHELFEKAAQTYPDAPAVCAWDGDWTYKELDTTTTVLARRLVRLGIGAGSIVPLCFEKSRWMPVAMLAVMKAGGASAAMDTAQPEGRLRTVVQQTGYELLLSSPAKKELATRLDINHGRQVVVVSKDLIDEILHSTQDAIIQLPIVSPFSRLYIAFTSGSTGVPKGAIIYHFNISSYIHHLHNADYSATAMPKIGPTTRIYDFSSYAFDACWLNVFLSLTCGGCLCIPSDMDRADDLAGSIQRLQANYAFLTPSTASLLSSKTIKFLRTLLVGGEAIHPRHARRLMESTLVWNVYGPCECTPLATIGVINKSNVDGPSIGKGLGVNTWIVQTSNHDSLAPIGDTGELVLEGPLVGGGYLCNSTATGEAFIKDPAWLMHGTPGHQGRHGRLYKTGDLVRYTSDGSLIFVGRKSTAQVKIRGQRIELGDIEHHVHACFPLFSHVAVDIIVPIDKESQGQGQEQGREMLAAFLVKRDKEPPASSEAQARVVAISPEIENQLAQRLPGYMNPTAYFLLHELPRNSSGKLDRCRLREVGAGFTLEQLSQARETSRGEKQALKTDTERALQQIWSHVLGIDAARIGANDNFLRLGGDSIGAMQASAAARARGINTSTADILQRKTVSLLAAAAADDWSAKHRLPELDFAGVAAEKEEDCQPFELSPVQRLCLTTQPDSIFCSDQGFNLRLCEHISLERLAEALETIVMRHPMLRARFKQCGKDGWKQHIVSDSLSSFHLDQAVSTEFVGAKAVLETEMCRCRGRLNIETGPVLAAMLFESEDTHGSQNLFLAAHHLVVDAMSWRILLGELQELLRGRRLPTLSTVSFQRWCSFQAQNATDSVTSLKGARLQPPALLYWGSGALVKAQGAMVSSDFTLAEAPTAALMGSCNLAFDTLPLELMVASLVHSFSAVFRDRPPPTVFTEGHGREAWGDRVDLSHTIGLFTTVSPSSESRETAMESDLLGTICRTKDFARSMSDKKGACLFTTTTHAGEYPVEVIFNYVGPHQPMGQGNSLFDMVSSPSEDSNPIVGSQLHRLSLLSFKASLDRRSRLAVTLEYPTDIRHSEKIGTWMDEFEATLVGLGALLLERLPEWTLTDFPLAFTSYDHLREFDSTIMHRLGITNRHDIEDMYPCSGLQEGLVVAQAKSPGLYRSRFNVEITATQVENGDCIDVSRIERAWRAVVKRHSLLRAILVNGVPGSTGVMHIVLRNPAVGISIDAHAEDEDENDDGHASRYKYAKYAPQHHLSISRITNTHVRLCFEINHTIVDGHSGRLLLTDFWQAYRTGTLASSGPSYRDYIQYVQQRPRDVDREFWVKYLDGVQPCFFSSSSVSVKNLPSQDLSVAVPGLNTGAIHDFCSRWEVTSASVVQMAWALVLRCYTGSEIPCFGNLASGRDAPLDGVEDIFGPLIGMMPYCVRLGAGRSVIETVRQGQKDMIAGMPHQTYPLMEIHKVLGVGSSGLFNSIMSFQRVDDRPPTPSADGHVMRERGGSGLSEYPVALSVGDSSTHMSIVLDVKAGFLSHKTVDQVARAMGTAVMSIVRDAHQEVSDVNVLPEEDLEQLWNWNAEVPSADDRLVHHLIQDQARCQPEDIAICAWDGQLTYSELDKLTSHLASQLTSSLSSIATTTTTTIAGLKSPNPIIPLCFEKSMWAPVAALAALKAGAGFVLLDPSLPEQRLQSIVRQVGGGANLMLSSFSTLSLSSRLCKAIIVVGPTLPHDLARSAALAKVTASPAFLAEEQTNLPDMMKSTAVMYVVFTSGSTGTPKGAVLSHRNFCSSLKHQSHIFGFRQGARIFDFASYATDVAISNIFGTFAAGATLCIPSETDRRDNLSKSLADFNATIADLTPSVARLIDPAAVPALETILLGGEAIRVEDVRRWWGKVRFINAYGPAECTATSIINESQSSIKEAELIGKGAGTVTWVVDPDNHMSLLPPGCAGELLLEGPLVGYGYLDDAVRSDKVFVRDPKWLLAGAPGKHNGRRGRLYKTGDIVRYTEDGSLAFIGRKQDTQVKIRGQRVELGEVEHWVQRSMPDAVVSVVADVFKPLPAGSTPSESSQGSSVLAAFLQLRDGLAQDQQWNGEGEASSSTSSTSSSSSSSSSSSYKNLAATRSIKIHPMTPNVEATLTKNLPVYMVPSVLFTVQALPTTPTGKTDRRRLREMAAQFSTEQLAEAQTAGLPKRQPTCEAEHLMQSLWARILNLQADIIGLDDSFLRLGGDSISAMRLVNEARKDGFHLSVADVFHRDTLSEMVARQHPGRGAMTHPASESSEVMLIDDAKKEKLLQQIDALDLDMRSEDVADILPVTRMQERYFDKSTYMPSCAGHNDRTLCGRYANYFYLDLSASTDVSRLEAACAQGLTRFPILRACFLRLQGKLWQVVLHKLKRPLRVQELDNDRTSLDEAFHSFCIADAHQGSEVEPPVALVLLKHKLHDMRLVIRISHAQYDGICFPIVVEALVKGWDPATPAPPDFSAFLLDAERRRPQSIAYWKEVLRGSLPTGLLKQIAPYADSTEKRQQLEAIHLEACVTIPSRLPNKISTATLASAAWALLLSRLSGQDEVVFGRTVAGRNTAIQDIDRVVGCCINFIPVRVSLSSFQTAAQLLQGVQDQFLAVGDADSLSYQEILENCTGWPAGSKFESTIVHQNFNEDLEIELGGATSRVQFFDNPHTMPQWIYLITRTKGDQLHLELFSNTHITSQETAHAMMDDYSHIITSFNGSVDNLPLT